MLIYGRNVVLTALESAQHIKKIWISKTAHGDVVEKIKKLAMRAEVELETVPQQVVDKRAKAGTTHQGILADMPDFAYAKMSDLLHDVAKAEKSVTIILDQITDPHNFGAIIRTAECAGCRAIIIPSDNSSSVNETVLKVSVGAAFYLPIIVSNDLSSDIAKLKQAGMMMVATSSQSETSYTDLDYSGHSGLIIGNEATGIRKFIKKQADHLIHIPIKGKMESLNASVAAGICIYEMVK
jgi:23S rRNA (guanosine2251-2'-O)-methyltransferase